MVYQSSFTPKVG